MVCFVFTAYTPIGEAVDIEAVDISKGSKKKSSSRAELPLSEEDVGAFESKENHYITLEGTKPEELEAGFEYIDPPITGQPSEIEPHLNERILQLQKESLATPTEDDGDDGDDGGDGGDEDEPEEIHHLKIVMDKAVKDKKTEQNGGGFFGETFF